MLSFFITPIIFVLMKSQLSWDFRGRFGEANVQQGLFQLAKGKVDFNQVFFFSCKFYQVWVAACLNFGTAVESVCKWCRKANNSMKTGSFVAGTVVRFFCGRPFFRRFFYAPMFKRAVCGSTSTNLSINTAS